MDLGKVYTLSEVLGVPLYNVLMPLPSNSLASPIIIYRAFENFLIPTQTCRLTPKYDTENFDLNYAKRTDLRLRFPGNLMRESPRTIQLGTSDLMFVLFRKKLVTL